MRSTLRFEKRVLVDQFLANHPCVDCGKDDPDVLDFDHVKGIKIKNVSEMITDTSTLEQLVDEIDKCEVRCANCHRKITRLRERGLEV